MIAFMYLSKQKPVTTILSILIFISFLIWGVMIANRTISRAATSTDAANAPATQSLDKHHSDWLSRTLDNIGQEEYYLGVGFNPIWSPNGDWMIYNDAKEAPSSLWDHVVITVPVGDWENRLPLPIDAQVQDWIEE